MQVHLKVKNSFMHSKSHVPFVHFNPSVPCITFVPWALVRTSPRMHWGKAGGGGGALAASPKLPTFGLLMPDTQKCVILTTSGITSFLSVFYFEILCLKIFQNFDILGEITSNFTNILGLWVIHKNHKMPADVFFLWRD